ncbi:hypothetical protein [Spiroplasma endosymbiont of Diplazon laetatorius]|uniref:hypothetical protein n=1 Tax=Spiroplasma endosymbiont of Diplazon laetatorius TaxID=3066322 RepID=UPI0030CBA1C9
MTAASEVFLDLNEFKLKRRKLTFVKWKKAEDFLSLIKEGFISKGKVLKRSNNQEVIKGDPSWLVTNSLGIQDFDRIKVFFEETKDVIIGSNNIVCFVVNAKPRQRKITLNFVRLFINGCGENMTVKSKILNRQKINF